MTMNNQIDLDALIRQGVIDKHAIAALNTEEKNALIKMFSELKETGSSNTLKGLWYEDYDEIPVDIDTFIDDPEYLGNALGSTIYPFWRDRLRELFKPGAKYYECLAFDTLIPVKGKAPMTIDAIHEGIQKGNTYELYSYDESTGEMVTEKCTNSKYSGKKVVYEVGFSTGDILRLTANHEVLMSDGSWKETRRLVIGDLLKSTDDTDKSVVIDKILVDGIVDVYDLEIERTHNFAVSSGVIVHNCILTGGIGLGKTTIADVGMAYVLHRLLCLKNPQSYYGLTRSSVMTFNFFNVSMDLSYGVAYKKIQDMLKLSPWFLRHGEIVGSKNLVYVPSKSISFRVGSKVEHSLGQDIFCVVGDTKVVTDDYGAITIEELVGKSFQVYQIDDKGYKVLSDLCTAIETKMTDELIELELEDGSIFKATPEHRVMMMDGSYKMIKDIEEGEEVYSIGKA